MKTKRILSDLLGLLMVLASNAKLVAEWYASREYWEMYKTISAWHVEPTEVCL